MVDSADDSHGDAFADTPAEALDGCGPVIRRPISACRAGELSRLRRAVATRLGVLALLLLSACAPPSPSPSALRVLAAASLTDVLQEIIADFDASAPGGPVEASFGSSSALARQIRDGAPADVFVSASPQWMDDLRQAGALDGEPIVFARNRLVAVAPPAELRADLDAAPLEVSDLRSLLAALAPDDRIAIADEGVPAGEYARAALAAQGLLDAFLPRLVGQSDVRAALQAVEKGQLPAGFVYATDAAVARVEVLFAVDSPLPIEYQAAALAGAADPEAARSFLTHLEGAETRRRLEAAGFLLPGASRRK